MEDTALWTPSTQRRGLLPAMHRAFALSMLVLSPALFRVPAAAKQEGIHTVVTTECTPYFDWQVLGLWYRYWPRSECTSCRSCLCPCLSRPGDVLSAAWKASSSARLMAEFAIRRVKCALSCNGHQQQTSLFDLKCSAAALRGRSSQGS